MNKLESSHWNFWFNGSYFGDLSFFLISIRTLTKEILYVSNAFAWKAPMFSHDSEFSRTVNYLQLVQWSFRNNQYHFVNRKSLHCSSGKLFYKWMYWRSCIWTVEKQWKTWLIIAVMHAASQQLWSESHDAMASHILSICCKIVNFVPTRNTFCSYFI